MQIFHNLKEKGYKVKGIDPNLDESNDKLELISIEQSMDEIDIFVIFVKHKEFLKREFILKIKKENFLDFCGLLSF